MMKTYIIFMLVFLSFKSFAQETKNDSYTIQRLIIYNQKGEILLEKHKNGWMTPALRHNSKETTKEGLRKLASQFGLEVSEPSLAGMFMFISQYKPQSSFRQHYVCNKTGGTLKLPKGKLNTQWFPSNKVIEIMSLRSSKLIFAVRDMTKQIINYPKVIWGGTFILWKEKGITKYRMSERFYKINE